MAITRAQQAKQMLQDGGMLVNQDLVVLDKDTVVMVHIKAEIQVVDVDDRSTKNKLIEPLRL